MNEVNLTVKKFKMYAEIQFDIPRELLLSREKEIKRQMARKLADEIIGNGLVQIFQEGCIEREVYKYHAYLRLGVKPENLP